MANETKLILENYDPSIIKNNLEGVEQITDVDRNTRFKICQDCEELEKKWHTCGICKCWMPVKARLPGTKCPLGKW